MKILAIGAHPDDIEYGCAGTLIKYAQKDHDIYFFVATKGEFGGNADVRVNEQLKSAEIMGVKDVFWGDYKDTEIPLNQGLIAKIEDVIHQVNPDFIFTHYHDDTHQDHRTLAQGTLSATRYIRNFLFYEVPTTQNFTPNVYVDINSTLELKLSSLETHKSQVSKTNIEDLTIIESAISCANFRGIQGRVKYAEGFQSLRLFINI